MNDILVSVVMPVRDREDTVARAVDSVLSQDVPGPVEIIAVDDGSEDGTARVLESYGDRLRMLRLDGRGPSAARNAGVDAARGRFIAFLDSDDQWLPGKLAVQMDVFETRPHVGVCGCGAEFVDMDGGLIKRYLPRFGRDQLTSMLFENLLVTPTVMVRAEILRAMVPMFRGDMSFAEDWEFMIRLVSRAPAHIVGKALVRCFESANSAHKGTDVEDMACVYKGMFERLRSDPVAGRAVELNRGAVAANLDALMAHELYGRGEEERARDMARACFKNAPWRTRLKTLAPMLLLPRPARDALRRLRGWRG